MSSCYNTDYNCNRARFYNCLSCSYIQFPGFEGSRSNMDCDQYGLKGGHCISEQSESDDDSG